MTNTLTFMKAFFNRKLAGGDTSAGRINHMGVEFAPVSRKGVRIGYGFDLEREWPEELWDVVLRWEIEQARRIAEQYSWFKTLSIGTAKLSTPRQAVIIALIKELGADGFVITDIQEYIGKWVEYMDIRAPEHAEEYMHYAGNAIEMLDLPEDKTRILAEMMLKNEWPKEMEDAA